MNFGKIINRSIQLCVMFGSLVATTSIYAQNIEYNIRLNAGTGIYEVYYRPDFTVNPPFDQTSTSQATIVAPNGQPVIPLMGEPPFNPAWGQVTSNAGSWSLNARVDAPTENPNFDYISVGLQAATTAITYSPGVEVLVFSFTADECLGPMEVIVNGVDPFDIDPNSANSNPGNEVTVLGFGNNNLWANNYDLGSANCVVVDINDVTVNESAGNAVFTVSLVDLINGGPATTFEDITLTVTTTDGTAEAGSDYTATTIQVTIPAGSSSTTAAVPVTDDLLDENDETFTLSVQSVDAGAVADSSDTGTGTIQDNDDPPGITIDNVTVNEGDGSAVFTVTLSAASSFPVDVTYTTNDNTALQPGDYTLTAGTLNIPAGATSATISVPIIDDLLDEATERYRVNLSAPVNATIIDGVGLGTILDNDPPPALSIDDVTVDEGAGTATFTVSLSAVSGLNVTVSYTTNDGTAVQPDDYGLSTDFLVIPAGDSSGTITVPITEDLLDEPDETYTVDLSVPVNGTIADGQGLGTILDNDPAPVVTISDSTATEGDNLVFDVTLSGPSSQTITLDVSTSDGTAVDPADYTGQSLTLTFNPGDTALQVIVPTTEDIFAEPTETMSLQVDSSTGPVGDTTDTGTGTILDDDSLPDVTVDDLVVNEDVGSASVTVNLSGTSNQNITLTLSTSPGSASDPADYTGGASFMVTILAGTTSGTVAIPIVDDNEDEAAEDFVVSVTPNNPAQVGDTSDTGTVTILDNDPPIALDDSDSTSQDQPVTVDWDDNDTLGPEASLSSVDSNSTQGGVVTDNNNGTFTYQPPTGYQGTDTFNYEVCDLGPDGTPSTGDEQCDTAVVTITVNPLTMVINLRVLLQGAYTAQTDPGLMRDDLRVGDGVTAYIPTQEPYTAMANFSHVGTLGGTEVVDPLMFDATGPDAPVDWVFVEIRDPLDPSVVLASRSGMLQRDGDVMDVDGITGLLFVDVIPGDYHVSVRHRNHIGVMTQAPVALNAVGELVDFTVNTTPNFVTVAEFAGQSQKAMPDGKLALWGGNGNGNSTIIFQGPANDPGATFFEVLLAAGNATLAANFIEAGYRQGDFDMNGLTIFQGPANDVNFVFFNVLLHSVNFPDLLANFVIPEQLP